MSLSGFMSRGGLWAVVAEWRISPAEAVFRFPSAVFHAMTAEIMSRSLSSAPLVGIIMGSSSDWPTMRHAAQVLEDFGVAYEKRVVSAHRTPELLYDYSKMAQGRGLHCIIAGAGGAAHLPGMAASMTTLPVLGVPVQSKALSGVDSLYSIVQMPGGIPVATFAIGNAGATNAGLFAIALLANHDAALAAKLVAFREKQRDKVLASQAEIEDTPAA
jgi:5-(carboxyamino)imidazole ribonucleotide mutase